MRGSFELQWIFPQEISRSNALSAGEVVRFPNPLAFKSGGDPVYGEAVQRWPVGFDGRNVVEHLARTTSDGRWWEMAPRGLLTNQVTYIQKAELMGVLTPPIWRDFFAKLFKNSTASFIPTLFNHCLSMPIILGKEDCVKFSLFVCQVISELEERSLDSVWQKFLSGKANILRRMTKRSIH